MATGNEAEAYLLLGQTSHARELYERLLFDPSFTEFAKNSANVQMEINERYLHDLRSGGVIP